MNVVGIIPARGQSKGIPRKNLAPLGGKPLIAWTIEAAAASRRLSRFFVSTEDAEISNVAYDCGASVMMRPPSLATDEASTLAVLDYHARTHAPNADAIMCLQPTCPLRRPEDIDGAIELMESTGCDSVVSYVDVGANHPLRMVVCNAEGKTLSYDARRTPSEKIRFLPRDQLLSKVYLRSGDIYLTRRAIILAGSLLGCDSRAWFISRDRWCNIDEPRDLVIAEALMRHSVRGAGADRIMAVMD